MKIVYYPDPVLTRRASAIETVDDEIRDKAETMLDLMAEAKGVGLAAPQVGWSARMFVMNATGEPEDAHVLINPKIVKRGSKKVLGEEGCLSIPKIYIEVERAQSVEVEYLDPSGEQQSRRFEDFEARIIQHEYDHLEGILLIHKMSPVDRIQYKDALRDLESARP